VPFAGPEEVFRRTSEMVGHLVRWLPDGETETGWIANQMAIATGNPYLTVGTIEWPGSGSNPCIELVEGASAEDVAFEDLDYARIAEASYAVLQELKAEGAVPADVRLQVNLPSPVTVSVLVHPEQRAALEPRYEEALIAELDRIVAAIPHEELVIGWDIPTEVLMLEGGTPAWFPDVMEAVLDRLARLVAHVPADVPVGFHFCLGSRNGRHEIIPQDASNQVELANRLAAELPRRIEWLHLPIPREADAETYVAPLARLRLDSSTALFFGVVDTTDGKEASQERIAALQSVLDRDFGVAAVCGLGQVAPDQVVPTLELHAQLAEPVR